MWHSHNCGLLYSHQEPKALEWLHHWGPSRHQNPNLTSASCWQGAASHCQMNLAMPDQGLGPCCLYVMGCPNLIVAVDHVPLVILLGDWSLNDISNSRLLRLKEKTALPLLHQTCAKGSQQGTWQVFPTTLWSWLKMLGTWRHQSMPLQCHTHPFIEDMNPFNAIIRERVKEATHSEPPPHPPQPPPNPHPHPSAEDLPIPTYIC